MPFARTRQQQGFTLVEIAIVLVIIGLILGGVLKGQELVVSARVRNIADQQNAMKAAFYAFEDRYKALPGDYQDALTNIPGLTSSSKAVGNGDGFVANGTSAGEVSESVYAFLHLALAGFISCQPCVTKGDNAGVSPLLTNSPSNVYNGVLALQFDSNFGDPSITPNANNNLKTGSNIPSNILAEVDSKLDDGSPYTGSFQFSSFTITGGTAPVASACIVAATATSAAQWNRQTPSNNCGAAYQF